MPEPKKSSSVRPYTDEELQQMAVGEKTIVEMHRDGAGAEKKPDQRPTLLILQGNTVAANRLDPTRPTTSLGSSREEADMQIYDQTVAGKQVSFIPYHGEWIIADCGAKDMLAVDGIPTRQIVCPWGSRAILAVGRVQMVFAAYDVQKPPPAGGRVWQPKRTRLHLPDKSPAVEATVKITAEHRVATSTGEPLLIGSHAQCDAMVAGEGVKPFHAMIFWASGGVFVRSLDHVPLHVNKRPLEGDCQLTDQRTSIQCGGQELTVDLEGDCAARAAELVVESEFVFENFCLSQTDWERGESFTFPSFGGAVTVGRSQTCDIIVNDRGVSRVHAQLIPSGKSFYLIDNYSSNGTFVNGEKITKARCHAGDLVEIGSAVMMVHYC